MVSNYCVIPNVEFDNLATVYQLRAASGDEPRRSGYLDEPRWRGYKPVNAITTSWRHDEILYDYQPRTELGKRLLELRRKYIERGGRLLSEDELEVEIRSRRGGVRNDE